MLIREPIMRRVFFRLENRKTEETIMTSAYTIERARPEDAAALLDYLKIIGGETDNLARSAVRRTMRSILPRWTARSSARPV